jgi:DNA invertase Pin-like site-specific DNA recombinase
MGVIAAVAQFERDLLIERTLSGQARARAEGKRFGRPETLQRLADGASISAVAREKKASRVTIMARTAAIDSERINSSRISTTSRNELRPRFPAAMIRFIGSQVIAFPWRTLSNAACSRE